MRVNCLLLPSVLLVALLQVATIPTVSAKLRGSKKSHDTVRKNRKRRAEADCKDGSAILGAELDRRFDSGLSRLPSHGGCEERRDDSFLHAAFGTPTPSPLPLRVEGGGSVDDLIHDAFGTPSPVQLRVNSPTAAPTDPPTMPPTIPQPTIQPTVTTEQCQETDYWKLAPGTRKNPVLPCTSHSDCDNFRGKISSGNGPCCLYPRCICGSTGQDKNPGVDHCMRPLEI